MGLNLYPQPTAGAAIPQSYQWPQQGQWTYEDYCRLPEDGWIYEIIDRHKKFAMYAKAGVREYWILDPQARTIELFVLKQGAFELVSKYVVGKTVKSKILKGFAVEVKEVCPG